MRLALLMPVLALTACGPGVADFDEDIGNTNYRYVRTDGRSYWIYPSNACGPACPSISRNIVEMKFNDHIIAVRRQVVNDYRCDDGYISSAYLNQYEQYVILLDTNKLIGPMTVAEYETFQQSNPKLFGDITLIDQDNHFDGGPMVDGKPMVLSGMDSCTNPQPQ